VLGFFNEVYPEIEREYAAQIDAKILLCIRQGPPNMPDFSLLSTRLHQLPRSVDSLVVLLATFRDKAWVKNKVEAMTAIAGVKTEIIIYKNAGYQKLVEDIASMGLAIPDAINMEGLRKILGEDKVLCVSANGRPKFCGALKRNGFSEEAVAAFFVERIVSSGKNSNLLSVLSEAGKSCQHLLYAYDGLRTLSPEAKASFSGKCYEAVTAGKVVIVFRKWLDSQMGEKC